MKISQMIRDLADQPYRKDYRLQRHIIEDEDCQDAKTTLAQKIGPHDAGHLLSVMDSILMYVHEHGMPEDMADVLATYRLNGAKNRRGSENRAPELTAEDFAAMWGDEHAEFLQGNDKEDD